MSAPKNPNPMPDYCAERCGHNFYPYECPYEFCGYRDTLKLLVSGNELVKTLGKRIGELERDLAEAIRVRDLAREASGRALEAKRVAEAQLKRFEQSGIVAYLRRQWAWSKRTFGPGKRTRGIIEHIRKELIEIEAAPHDLSEWVDVAILAADGYWRHGGAPEQFMADMQAKQDKNFARVWPEPKSEDEAVEHDRSAEPRGGCMGHV